jgi:tetratricopeptide (TPR) repeat protein
MAQIGPFVLEDVLGRGAVGRVWRAHHAATGFPVAIKACPPGYGAELDALARLQHPAIVDVLDGGDVPADHPVLAPGTWLAMERGTGTLHDHLGTLSWPVVQRIGSRLLDALAVAHGAGVLHRDLKPSNILVGCRRSLLQPLRGPLDGLRLADFGLAWSTGRAPGAAGTPGYAAPEQIEGTGLGPWTDLHGWAAVVWALVTGTPPTRAGFQPLIDVPPGLEGVLRRGLVRAAERFQHVAEVRVSWEALGPAVAMVAPAVEPRDEPLSDEATAAVVAALAPLPEAELAPRPSVPPLTTLPVDEVAWPSAELRDAGRGLWSRRPWPFMGREALLDDLVAAWRPGAVLGVVGDPGVGCSRLIDELLQRVGAARPLAIDDRRTHPFAWLEGDGMPVVVVDRRADTALDDGVVLVDGGPGDTTFTVQPLTALDVDGLWEALGFAPSTIARLVLRFDVDLRSARRFVDDAMASGAVETSADGWVLEVPLPPETRTVDELLEAQRQARRDGRSRDMVLLGTRIGELDRTPAQDGERCALMLYGANHLLDGRGARLRERLEAAELDPYTRADVVRWEASIRGDRPATLAAAQEMLRQARTDDERWAALRGIGWARVVLGRFEEAAADLLRIADDPRVSAAERSKAYQGLGLLAERRHDDREAYGWYQRAVAVVGEPEDQQLARTLARYLFNIHVKLGLPAEDWAARVQEAIARSGDLRQAHAFAATRVPWLENRGEHEAARRLAIRTTGSPDAVARYVSWVNLGLSALQQGDTGLLARVIEGIDREGHVADDSALLRALMASALAAYDGRRTRFEEMLEGLPERWRTERPPAGELGDALRVIATVARGHGWRLPPGLAEPTG